MSLRSNQETRGIGARFRSARALVPDLNRKSFCERYGINRYTMQSWENGLHVSKGKNVEKFIEALAREGVFCTSEWLIEGQGDPARPMASQLLKRPDSSEMVLSEDPGLLSPLMEIARDMVEFYGAKGQNLRSFCLPDDAMAPKFLMNDVVIGQRIETSYERAHQRYCMVELGQGRMIVRKVLVLDNSLLLLALDDRVMPFSLSLSSTLYEIVWHLLSQ